MKRNANRINLHGLEEKAALIKSKRIGWKISFVALSLDEDDGIQYGSEELLAKVLKIRPRYHLFGHVHSQHGILRADDALYSNGAIMNSDYSSLNTPNIIEL